LETEAAALRASLAEAENAAKALAEAAADDTPADDGAAVCAERDALRESNAQLTTKLAAALEDRKLLRRHAKQQDERNLEVARDATRARAACDAAMVEAELARGRAASAQATADVEKANAAEVWEQLSKMEEEHSNFRAQLAQSSEATKQKQHQLLVEMRCVVSELTGQTAKLRSELKEAESTAVANRVCAEAAREASRQAARGAALGEEASSAQLRAARAEASAAVQAAKRGAADLVLQAKENADRQVDRDRAVLQRALDESRSEVATARADAEREAAGRSEALSKLQAAEKAASDALAALALSKATKSVAFSTRAKSPPPKNGHAAGAAAVANRRFPPSADSGALSAEPGAMPSPPRRFAGEADEPAEVPTRIVLVAAAFSEGPLGVHVAFDLAAGRLRVSQVKGAALQQGVLVGDWVDALDGVQVPLNTRERDFAAMISRAARPICLDFHRTVHRWREEADRHPPPPFGLWSPVVQHVLEQWSADAKKLQYVRLWLCVATNADDKHAVSPRDFPAGLELAGLQRGVLDGFLTLVVPLIRAARGRDAVQARSRPSAKTRQKTDGAEEELFDLQLQVTLPTTAAAAALRHGATPGDKAPKPAGDASLWRTSWARGIIARGIISRPSQEPKDEGERLDRQKEMAKKRAALVEEKLAKMRSDAERR